jgi:nifR3 family TIM-barrel protein
MTTEISDCNVLSKTVAIGGLVLDNPLVLAPMAGITQLPLRRLAKEQGCALVVSEMISANGLVHGGQKTWELLQSHPSERPLSVQIFGKDPGMMKEAGHIVQGQGADLLDINLGCSVRKVVKQGAGAALMREPTLLASILRSVREAVDLPLTIKIRSGWDPSGDQALAVGRIAQDAGVDAVAIHPRTALQGFSGQADWSLIARLKEALTIPVVGNGDITTPQDTCKMKQDTGCDAVMIGRASMGNPWIFSQALDLMNGRRPKTPDVTTRLETICRYIRYAVAQYGELRAVRMMRSRLAWFVKGLPRCSRLRETVIRLESEKQMVQAIKAYFEGLQDSGFSGSPTAAQ